MSNYFVFTDEAGAYQRRPSDAHIRSHPFYVRSNVLMDIDDYRQYQIEMQRIAGEYEIPFDELDPELRSQEEVDGKKRIREFYAMTPEDAYSILEAIVEINGYKHRLKKWKATAAEQKDEAMAQEISEAHQERMAPFTFSMCNISVGEEIEFWRSAAEPSGLTCTVADDKHVEYDGQHELEEGELDWTRNSSLIINK